MTADPARWFVVDASALLARPTLDPAARLRLACALHRVHALACIESAQHGWLGACFSATEILSVLYCALGERDVVLSKGHAAALQYACLVSCGALAPAALLTYKDGPAGLQAHTDRRTPGILLDGGSLGQALSQVAGLALVSPGRRFFVVIGDGELQEGQCWEAFQTLVARQLTQVTVIIDCNGWQTARPVSGVKRVADLGQTLTGLGLAVVELDGHDPEALSLALGRPALDAPRVVLARTVKGGGSPALAGAAARLGLDVGGSWHGRVPDESLYLEVVAEQVGLAGDPELSRLHARWLETRPAVRPASPRPSRRGATGPAFAEALTELAQQDPQRRLVALDADLAQPCGIDGWEAAGLPFYEMGISEQDLVGCAAGLALAGRLPVVHTYASFFRRATDQLLLAQRSGARVIYAGHYAGLDYFTDGKTHQSLDDRSLLGTLPGLLVAEPCDAAQATALLRWAVQQAERSVYFRLHRLPGASLPVALADAGVDAAAAVAGPPLGPRTLVQAGPGQQGRALLACGPVAAGLACRFAAEQAEAGEPWSVVTQALFGLPPDLATWRRLLAPLQTLVVVDDDRGPGNLYGWVCRLLVQLGLSPRVTEVVPGGEPCSFLSYEACLTHHDFTPAGIRRRLAAARGEGR